MTLRIHQSFRLIVYVIALMVFAAFGTRLAFAHHVGEVFSHSFADIDEGRFVRADLDFGLPLAEHPKIVPGILRLDIDSGWKVVAVASDGDQFLPSVVWSEQDNFSGLSFRWPDPEPIVIEGIEGVMGYHEGVTIPVQARFVSADDHASAEGILRVYVCRTLCVVEELSMNMGITRSGDLLADAIGNDALISFNQRAKSLWNASRESLGPLSVSQDSTEEAARSLAALSTGPSSVVSPMLGGRFLTLIWIVFIPFLAGLALNILPCSWPILGIKLASIQPRSSNIRLRLDMGLVGLGILLGFLSLGFMFVLMRSAGEIVGWGLQFQSPSFVWVSLLFSVLLFVDSTVGTGLMVSGRLTGKLDGMAFRIQGWRSVPDAMKTMGTGFVIALLASACTVPLWGGTLAAVMSTSPVHTLVITVMIGLGFAVPVLILAIWPPIAHAIYHGMRSRSNRFLQTIGRLIVPLLTLLLIVWLGSLLFNRVTLMLAGLSLIPLVMIVLMAVMAKSERLKWARSKIASLLLFQSVIVVLFALIIWGEEESRSPFPTSSLDQSAINRLVDQGHTVLVVVSADWCMSCEVNDALIYNRSATIDWLQNRGVSVIRADWSRADDRIGEFLAAYVHEAIPFAASFGPARPDGVVLSGLLTFADLKKAVELSQKFST